MSDAAIAERLDRAEAILGHRFTDRDILELSLRHASTTEARLESNERLEFLGDAVLGVITCERIFERFPDLLEGEMTKIKSTIVSRRTCAEIAESIDLEELIEVGKGMTQHGRLPRSLGAAVLESVIGAVYVDGGLRAVKDFLLPLLDPLIDDAARSGHQRNFKSVLQQHAQQSVSESPMYRVLDEKGPDHAKAFCVAVELDGQRFEASWGQSKKQAEQQAALNALHELGLIEHDDEGALRLVDDDAEHVPIADNEAQPISPSRARQSTRASTSGR